MNSVTAPSRAPASRTNFATSAVRSVKPAPGVCTASCEETMVVAATVDSGVRESDLGEVIGPRNRRVGKGALRAVPTSSCADKNWWARSAFPTLRNDTITNLAVDVLLHPVGHLDQPPPSPLQE